MEPFYTPITIPNIIIPYDAFSCSNINPNNINNVSTTTTTTTNCCIMMRNNNNPHHHVHHPWMDSRIWSRLPHRLIDRVIACLPPPAFFRARAVCKRWYGLIFSNTFLELYLQLSPHRHWFLFFKQLQTAAALNIKTTSSSSSIYKNDITTTTSGSTSTDHHHSHKSSNHHQACYLFDPKNLKWYRLSINPMIPPGFSPASSSAGLICWVSEDAGSKNILLSNPLIGSLIQLPSTLRPRLCPSIGLTITNSSIDLAIAGDDLISPYAVKNLTSESFHIDNGGFYSIWGTTSSLPRLCSTLESGRMVHVAGRFYCMNYSPFSVLCYDISMNQWGKIQAPMRRFLRSPNLVEMSGGGGGKQLILVAAVEKSKLNVPKSLRMWRLQQEECGWVEIERMPQQLYNQFAEIEGGRGFSCVGHGDFVVILIKGSSLSSLMFDFSVKRWVWVPPCPYTNNNNNNNNNNSNNGGGGDDEELHGFAYEPRLAVPITSLLDHLTLPFNSFTAA